MLLFGAGRVSAQTRAAKSQYEELVAEAVAEFERGNFSEARSFFSQAHAIEPNARTLRGLGMVAYEMRHYVEAVRRLRAALDSKARPLGKALRAETEALLRRAHGLVGVYHPRLTPADATLHVDGQVRSLEADGTLLLDVGEHQLSVSRDGYRSEERPLDVRGGDQGELVVGLQPEVVAPPPAAAAAAGVASGPSDAARTAGDSPRDEEGSVLGTWWFWTATVAVVGGGIAAFVLLSQDDETEPLLPGDLGLQTRALVRAP